MSNTDNDKQAEAAINIARSKLASLYTNEPDAKEEIIEAEETPKRTKHQQYMHDLSTSGRSLAEIQTAWHNYYSGLPDNEKHQVWQEFYSQHEKIKNVPAGQHKPEKQISHQPKAQTKPKKNTKPKHRETIADAKKKIVSAVTADGKISKKHHVQSILFGLGIGSIMVVVFLFGFFNERFIAPFITPSRSVSSTPIIIDPNSTDAGPENKVIIPKINVEIPVIYDSKSVLNAKTPEDLEAGIQTTLEDGVVHYPRTPVPGEKGNVPIVGHSSNNIFNQGKYKFAFVLLSKLEKGDTFYLTKNKVRYAYKIYDKRIVPPEDVSVLGPAERPSSATLITCDPPGTSINRLIVVGEQISPSPEKNKESKTKEAPTETQVVPGNSPSLWSRITGWIF